MSRPVHLKDGLNYSGSGGGSNNHLTDKMVANYENSSIAVHSYDIGEQFIYTTKLYEATSAISIGDTIVTDGANANCVESDSLTEQIAKKGSADNFIGTKQQWEALTSEEQSKYKTMDFIGDSIGGGGHTILNESGTEMPQRSKLQFESRTVTDDSNNDTTIVDGDSKDDTTTFTSSDDDATTEKTSDGFTSVTTMASGESHSSLFQKISKMFLNIRKLWNTVGSTALASGKTVTGLLGDTDISGVGSTVTGALNNVIPKPKLLWSNSSPNASFSPQTVSFTKFNGTFYIIEGKSATDQLITAVAIIIIGHSGELAELGSQKGTTGPLFGNFRFITASTNSSMTFAAGYGADNGTTYAENTRMIPQSIYGI